MNYLKKKRPGEDFFVEEIKKHASNTSENKSFRVGVDYGALVDINKSEFWPDGVLVRRYHFFRRQDDTAYAGAK